MSTRSCAVRVTIFSNGSIIPTGFKFTELHTLPLATCSYALLEEYKLPLDSLPELSQVYRVYTLSAV